jgi:O-antigen/teichoic acid export membrane protein
MNFRRTLIKLNILCAFVLTALSTIKQIASVIRFKPFNETSPGNRSRERYRRIAITTFTAIVARGVGVITALISVPLTLHYLGQERYGLWMTISSITAMLGFADLGMGNGLLNAIAEADGKDDTEAAKMYVSSAFFLLLGIASCILLGFLFIYSMVPWARVFNITSQLAIEEVGPATAVLFVSFVANMPLGVVQRVQMGYQQGFRTNMWIAVGAIMGLAGVLIAIYCKAGLPWLVLAMSGGPVLAILFNWYDFFFCSHRWLLPSWAMFDWTASSKVAGTGAIFLVLQLFALLGNTSDNIVIAQVLGASTVAGYAVMQKLFSITLIAQYFLAPLWPAFGEAIARDDRVWARRALNRAITISLILGLVTTLPFFFIGKRFIAIWVGTDMVPSTLLLVGFILWSLLNCYMGSISTYLNSGTLIGRQAICFGLGSVCSLILKIVGAPILQTEAVVWSTVLGYGLFYIIPATRLAYGSLDLSKNENGVIASS